MAGHGGRASEAITRTARRLQANHRGTEECRASRRDPTNSDRRALKAEIATAGRLQANHRGTEGCRASQGDPTDSDAPGNPTRKPGGVVMAADGGEHPKQKQQQQADRHEQRQQERQERSGWAVSSTFVAVSWPRTAASIESGHRNSRTFAGEPSGHRGLPSQPGQPDRQRRTREPNQEARRRWRSNKKDNNSATAGLLRANHRGTEDCRASQGDPTDSDTLGNPTSKAGASGKTPMATAARAAATTTTRITPATTTGSIETNPTLVVEVSNVKLISI